MIVAVSCGLGSVFVNRKNVDAVWISINQRIKPHAGPISACPERLTKADVGEESLMSASSCNVARSG